MKYNQILDKLGFKDWVDSHDRTLVRILLKTVPDVNWFYYKNLLLQMK